MINKNSRESIQRIAVDIHGIAQRRNKKQDLKNSFGMGRSLHVEPALVDRMQEYNVCMYVCM